MFVTSIMIRPRRPSIRTDQPARAAHLHREAPLDRIAKKEKKPSTRTSLHTHGHHRQHRRSHPRQSKAVGSAPSASPFQPPLPLSLSLSPSLPVFSDHRRVNLYLCIWLGWCARKTQGFILVRAERPYIQSIVARVTSTWFVVGVTNWLGREKVSSFW